MCRVYSQFFQHIVAEPGRHSLLPRGGANPSLGCLKLAVPDPRTLGAPGSPGATGTVGPNVLPTRLRHRAIAAGPNARPTNGLGFAERCKPLVRPLINTHPIHSFARNRAMGRNEGKDVVCESKGSKKKKLDGITTTTILLHTQWN